MFEYELIFDEIYVKSFGVVSGNDWPELLSNFQKLIAGAPSDDSHSCIAPHESLKSKSCKELKSGVYSKQIDHQYFNTINSFYNFNVKNKQLIKDNLIGLLPKYYQDYSKWFVSTKNAGLQNSLRSAFAVYSDYTVSGEVSSWLMQYFNSSCKEYKLSCQESLKILVNKATHDDESIADFLIGKMQDQNVNLVAKNDIFKYFLSDFENNPNKLLSQQGQFISFIFTDQNYSEKFASKALELVKNGKLILDLEKISLFTDQIASAKDLTKQCISDLVRISVNKIIKNSQPNDFTPIKNFLAKAIESGVEYSIKDFTLFYNKFSNVIDLEDFQSTLQEFVELDKKYLFFVEKLLIDYFTKDSFSSEYLERTTNYLLSKNYQLSFAVTDKLVEQFSKSNLSVQTIERIIEKGSFLSKKSILIIQESLSNSLMSLESSMVDFQSAIYIIKHLALRDLIKDEVLFYNFTEILDREVTHPFAIEKIRLVLDLYRSIANKFQFNDNLKVKIQSLANSDNASIKHTAKRAAIALKIAVSQEQFVNSDSQDNLEEYERVIDEKLSKYIDSLIKLGWSSEFLNRFIGQDADEAVKNALEFLYNYQVDLGRINRFGENAEDILSKAEEDDWFSELFSLYKDSEAYYPKAVNELISEFKEKNNDPYLAVFLEEKLKQITELNSKFGYKVTVQKEVPIQVGYNEIYVYAQNDEYYADVIKDGGVFTAKIDTSDLSKEAKDKFLAAAHNLIPQTEDFNTYVCKKMGLYCLEEQGEFLKWRSSLKEVNDDNIAGVIAHLNQAMRVSLFENQHGLRDVQILSVLALYKSNGGLMAQIATGEGKTTIIDVFAAINVLNGKKVDIISSTVLAKRDYEEQRAFYEILGISVAHNIYGSDRPKDCYKVDVLYGDMLNFIGDDLRDISKNVRFGREYSVVIIDEVDHVVINQLTKKIQLSGMIPGMEALKSHKIFAFKEFYTLLATMSKYCNDPLLTCTDGIPDIFDTNKTYIEFVTGHVNQFLKDEILSDHKVLQSRTVATPSHVKEFVKSHISRWSNSLAVSLFHYEENKNYVLYKKVNHDNNQETLVPAPIDKDSGNIEGGLRLSDGIHQFLELKHFLQLTSESVVANYKSYLGYLQKYKGSIYGLTGTLGNSHHKEFYQKVYNTTSLEIPQFIHKRITLFPPIICNDENQWLKELHENAYTRAIIEERAVLIIAETIDQVFMIRDYFEKNGYENAKLFTYGHNDDQSVVNRNMQPGDVLIATNLVGRGTNVKISQEVEQLGGLHLLLTIFPDSENVQYQNYGRPARKGQFGSAQLLFVDSEFKNDEESFINSLEQKRFVNEKEQLEYDQICVVKENLFKDELYEKLVHFIRNIKSPSGYSITLSYKNKPTELSGNSLYLYIDNNENILVDSRFGSKILTLDISYELKLLDLSAYKQAVTVLKNGSPEYGVLLSHQLSNLIYFITSYYGYLVSEKKDIILRITAKYEKSWLGDYPYFDSDSNFEAMEYPSQEREFLGQIKSEFEEEKKTQIDISKARLLKFFELWNQDLQTYYNNFEVIQITEKFGFWLRQQQELLEKIDCITQQDLMKQTQAVIQENLQKFFKEISEKIKQGALLDNPAYLIRSAFKFQEIWFDQDISYSKQIKFRGLYPFSDSQPAANSTESSWFNFVKDAISNFINYFRSPIGADLFQIQNPLDKALDSLDNAAKVERTYSWPAYNAKAFMLLFKESLEIKSEKEHAQKAQQVKSAYFQLLGQSLQKLAIVYGYKDAQLITILMSNYTSIGSPIVKQLFAERKILEVINASITKNVDFLMNSDKRTPSVLGDEPPRIVMLRPSKINNLMTMVENVTVSPEEIIKFVNHTSFKFSSHGLKAIHVANYSQSVAEIESLGGFIFETEVYELEREEQESGWFEGLVCGALMIALGAFTMGLSTSAFATVLGTSFVAQGLMTGIQMAMGQPFSTEAFLKSFGLNLAISVATAGIAHIAAAQNWITISPATFGTSFLTQQLVYAGFATVLNMAVSTILEDVYESNDGNIEASINNRVEELVKSCKAILLRIFVSDSLLGTAYQEKILQETQAAVLSYQSRYNSNGAKFLVEVAGSAIGLLSGGFVRQYNPHANSLVSSAIKVGIGVDKVMEAMDDFVPRMSSRLAQISKELPTDIKLLEERFRNSWSAEEATMMINELKTVGNFGSSLSSELCSKIESLALKNFAEKKAAMRETCDEVVLMTTNESMYSTTIAALQRSIASTFHHGIGGVFRNDIISPVSGVVSSVIIQKVQDAISKHQAHEMLKETLKELNLRVNEQGADNAEETSAGSRRLEKRKFEKGDTVYNALGGKPSSEDLEQFLKDNPKYNNPKKIKRDAKGRIIHIEIKPGEEYLVNANLEKPAKAAKKVCINKEELKTAVDKAKEEIFQKPDIDSNQKISAINLLDDIRNKMSEYAQSELEGRTVLKYFASKLDKFVTDYQWAFEVFSTIKLLLAAVSGPGSIVALSISYAKSSVTAKVEEKIIAEAAERIKEYDATLTDREALVLAGCALLAAGVVANKLAIVQKLKAAVKLKTNSIPEGKTTKNPTKADSGSTEKPANKIEKDVAESGKIPDNKPVKQKNKPEALETVKEVGGRLPINSRYAGKQVKFDSEEFLQTKKPGDHKKFEELAKKYPEGVRYDKQAYIDFGPYIIKEVKLKKFVNRRSDNKKANELAGFPKTPDGMTWHHHQDGKTMQLVPTDLHKACPHTGGVSTTKHGVKAE